MARTAAGSPRAPRGSESAGWGGCRALSEAATTAEVGPNLGNVLRGEDEDFVRESIVDRNGEIAEGYQPNVMPQGYEQRLSDGELDAPVTYLVQSVGS